MSARARLDRFSKGVIERERDQAFEEFLGEHWRQMKHLHPEEKRLSAEVFDLWFWLDRPLDEDGLVVERLLEVTEARPGTSLTLMDVLDGH